MTINVQLRKGSVTVVPMKVITDALASRQEGEDVNVMDFPGSILIVYPDGASAADIERLIDAAEAKRE